MLNKPYHCSTCGKGFNHSDNFQTPFPVNLSSEIHRQHSSYSSRINRRNSLEDCETQNLRQKSFKCPYCTHRCNRPSNLKTHIAYKHTRDLPHICSQCGRGFAAKSHLKAHLISVHLLHPSNDCNY